MKRCCLLLLCLLPVLLASGQPVNQNVSGGIVFEGEPFLVMDPADPRHMVVAWIGFVFGQPSGIKTRTTTDGGQTWSPVAILPHWRPTHKSADPSMVFDTNGDVLACYVDYRQNPDSGGTFVTRSTDGGLSWGAMSRVIDGYDDGSKLPVDRPWLTIDRSGGPYDGQLYVTTKPAPWVPAPNRPYLMRSSDGGQSWSSWAYLDAPGNLVGPYIQGPMATSAVATDGRFHSVYPSYELSQNFLPGFILATSTDGGATLTYRDVLFSAVNPADSLIKAGYLLMADPTDANHLAFVTPINLLGDQDIYLTETTDGGQSWTGAQRVNDDPGGSGVTQDLVWGAFDEDGDLVLTWRDRRNAAGSGYAVDSEIWGTVRWHDSTQFAPNFRLSDTIAAWNNILTQPGNDFMCSQFHGDTLSAVWGDTRNGRLNIYFVQWDLRNLMPVGFHSLGEELLPGVGVHPNPTADLLHIDGEGVEGVVVRDMQGRCVLRAAHGPVSLRHLRAGTYLVELETEAGEVTLRVVKE